MSYTLKAVYIVPWENMTEGRFATLLDDLSTLPRSNITRLVSLRPDASLFTATTRFWDVLINSVPVSMGGSTDPDPRLEDPLELPEGYERLTLWVSEGSIVGLPEQQGRLLEVLIRVFLKMGAEYTVTLHELDLSVESMPWQEFRTLLGGVHMFSRRLVDAVGRDRLVAAAPEAGDLDGGVWMRFQEEFFYGMPSEYQDEMRNILSEIWAKAGID